MRFIFNRDFKDYLHHPEWISLDNFQLSKNIWKKFGSRSNYLDSVYSNNWRIILVAKNQILSEHESIDLLKKSFKQYFSDNILQDSLITSITEILNVNHKQNRYQDSISGFRQKLLTKSLLHFTQAFAYPCPTPQFIIQQPNQKEEEDGPNSRSKECCCFYYIQRHS